MPFSTEMADEFIGPPKPGDVWVYDGPCSVHFLKDKEIPLDGRKFVCQGVVTFRNGATLRAKFDLDTTNFQFLSLPSLILHLNGLWYPWDEPELYRALGVSREDALPFRWLPDRPIAGRHHLPIDMPREPRPRGGDPVAP